MKTHVHVIIFGSRYLGYAAIVGFATESEAKAAFDALPISASSKLDYDQENSFLTMVEIGVKTYL